MKFMSERQTMNAKWWQQLTWPFGSGELKTVTFNTGHCLIEVTAWTGLTVYILLTRHIYCVNAHYFSVAVEILPCLPPHNKIQGSCSPGIELPWSYQSTTPYNMDITFLYVQLTCKKSAVLMVETVLQTSLNVCWDLLYFVWNIW